jgi:hypothetical protein
VKAAKLIIVIILSFFFIPVSTLLYADVTDKQISSPVRPEHLTIIETIFREKGLRDARVTMDRRGKVILKGAYKDKEDVELAYFLAQAVVGMKWVSPVTPENIKVRKIAKDLSQLFMQIPVGETIQPPKGTDTSKPDVRNPTKYGLVIGISKFQDNENQKQRGRRELDLRYAADDARAFHTYLTNPSGGGFSKSNVCILIDEHATRIAIERELENLRKKVLPDDIVVIYFATHGFPRAIDGTLDIIAYDSETESRETLTATSVKSERLKDFVNSTKVRNLLIVLDVCSSGRAFKGVFQGVRTNFNLAEVEKKDSKGISRSTLINYGSRDLFLDEGSGAATLPSAAMVRNVVLISSSGEEEKSWEAEDLKGGFFTTYFVQELQAAGRVRIAFEKSSERVRKDVLSKLGENQTPQVIASRPKDWDVTFAHLLKDVHFAFIDRTSRDTNNTITRGNR